MELIEFARQTINIVADLLITLIFIRIILSWFMRGNENRLMYFLNEATEPILKPIRRALPKMGMLDLSPLVAYFLIEIIRTLSLSII
jgi:YggT family protein